MSLTSSPKLYQPDPFEDDLPSRDDAPQIIFRRKRDPRTLPVDPNELTARLQNITPEIQARPRLPIRASVRSTPCNEDEVYENDLGDQTKYYNQLISEGGRPSHPVTLGRAILEDPGEYGEILSYWQTFWLKWAVFEPQLKNWQEFRKWQVANRADSRFPKYTEDVKRDLIGHGFKRQFRLQEDLELQDRLTTWIEYLGFEYWWYDGDVDLVKRRQPLYEKARKELEDRGVLRSLDTEEAIWSREKAFDRMEEEFEAKKAVIIAERALNLAQQPQLPGLRSKFPISQKERQNQLSAAQLKLDAAVKSLREVQTANGIINDFKTKVGRYRTAKKNIGRRSILLKWILEQIPQIELEMKSEKEAASKDNVRTDVRRGVQHGRDDELDDELNSKRLKPNGVPDHGMHTSCKPHHGRIVQHATTEDPSTMAKTSFAAETRPHISMSPKKKSTRSLSTGQSSSKETKSAVQKLGVK